MNEDEVQKAYAIVMKSLDDEDFKRWLEIPNIKDSLGFDYDQYSTHLLDNFEEPMGYDIWALGRYLERDVPDVPEGIDVITLNKDKPKESVERLHNALEGALGE